MGAMHAVHLRFPTRTSPLVFFSPFLASALCCVISCPRTGRFPAVGMAARGRGSGVQDGEKSVGASFSPSGLSPNGLSQNGYG
eukprot:CAMPEP_0113827962 /NCGR_PEP_ID=MMETSP0328-20130328/5034_1 /TAXON_ID=39455 /ORGANISM="Alexandrium minutum" /LENGTH=82 /DNA_ID=CAMNT_0000795961 /DNA_START=234 /DNA_END=478 /DNA_ORIENTATION=+ /assembly_acc=CAM_ASM_000350